MAKKLTAYVHVQNPDTNEYEVFGPDDKLPSWATKLIPAAAFDGGSDDDEEAAGPSTTAPAKGGNTTPPPAKQ